MREDNFKNMNKKSYIVFFTILIIIVFLYLRNGGKTTGQILMSMTYGLDKKEGLFLISMEGDKQVLEYYIPNEYIEVRFPIKKDENVYFVGKNVAGNYYTLIKLEEDNHVVEILKSESLIYFPTFLDEENVVFIKESEQNRKIYNLYNYNINTSKTTTIFNKPVDHKSKPIVSKGGSILFVADMREANLTAKESYVEDIQIMIMHPDGIIKELVDGKYPLLLEESNKILYYKDRSFRFYNLQNNKIKILKKNISVLESPVLSPDKKHIAFYEYGSKYFFDGVADVHYNTMSITGKNKKRVKEYTWGPVLPRGAEWISK